MSIGNRKSQNFFSQVPEVNLSRSMFDRSFTVKDTFNFDYLTPIYIDEVIPGDTINLNLQTLVRLQTQKVPIMDNMYCKFFFFYCPSRILWTNFTKMMGERENPSDSIDYTVPQILLPDVGVTVGSLGDKFGLPTNIAATLPSTNALPFRMYNKVYNDWFRDENLQNSLHLDTDNGPDDLSDYVLKKINKKHDYFTSALPQPQKGTALRIPSASTIPIVTNNSVPTFNAGLATNRTLNVLGGTDNRLYISGADPGTNQVKFGNQSGLQGDMTGIMGTINELRTAFQLQALLELDNRGGTRYNELVLSHFKVTIPDFRLQRSEYLGGGLININTSAVPNTADDLADLGAFATATASSSHVGFTHSFVEHGYVIGLAVCTADITYQQGLNKLWTRSTRYDFFWPELQQLGEQTILNKEIYYQGTSADNNAFGYAERYAEYKYKPSEIHGEMRSTYATPLDMWHLAEEFSSLPALNSTFIESNTPIDRAITVTTQDQLKADYYFNIKHTRPMMTHAVPVSLGRF